MNSKIFYLIFLLFFFTGTSTNISSNNNFNNIIYISVTRKKKLQFFKKHIQVTDIKSFFKKIKIKKTRLIKNIVNRLNYNQTNILKMLE